MLINRAEMIDELERNMRKFGGDFTEWCVGTARDARGPFFRRHFAEDLGDGLAYREGFTSDVAQAVVDHLVNDRGLEFDRDGEMVPGTISPSGTISPYRLRGMWSLAAGWSFPD